MARLIFICGHAGAGKTTLAKRAVPRLHARSGASYFLLDKDTVYGGYSQQVMGLLTGDPNDRDSPTYLQHLRDPEYHGMIDIARENVALGVNVVLVAPFSRELKSGLLFDPQALRLPSGCDVRVVWVSLDEPTSRRRIVERGDERDAYKLAHWEQYRMRRFSPRPEDFPQLLFFDNSHPDEPAYERLIDALLGGTSQR